MDIEDIKKKYEGLDLKSTARKLQQLRAKHEKQKAAAAETWHEVDYLRFTLLPELMEKLGTDNIKLPGIGRVSLRIDASCSTLDKGALYEWLENNGHPELMSHTVNSSTLKAFVMQQLRDGEQIPGSDIIDFKTFEMAVITKN